MLTRYRKQHAELEDRKEHYAGRRDAAQEQLDKLRGAALALYDQVQSTFVPLFTGLAEDFLGMDLQIHPESRQLGLQLVLRLEDQARRSEMTLSESQRFFVDIALRMALAQHLSADGSPAALYIDTPEGSLDITYESRAGQMFGRFAQKGFGLVMTANINTSKLLERLASACGSELMRLERMTEWAQLSKVQRDEEHLFDEAFEVIEAAMRGST